MAHDKEAAAERAAVEKAAATERAAKEKAAHDKEAAEKKAAEEKLAAEKKAAEDKEIAEKAKADAAVKAEADAAARAQPILHAPGNIKTIPIGYCGQKEQETDHLYGTGLVWGKDSVHEVPLDKAVLMLGHPDVWYDTRPEAIKAKKQVNPVAARSQRIHGEEEQTAAHQLPHDFDTMTAAQLDAVSVRNFNVSLDVKEPIATLRSQVRWLVERSKFNQT